MIISLKGPGVDFASTGHPLSWYEGIKAKGKTWVALDLMTSGFEADMQNALRAGLNVILFQGYYEPAWSVAAEAQSRAQFAVTSAKNAGYESGAPIVLDFESVPVPAPDAEAWCKAWSNAVEDAGYVPAIYIGVPQPLDGDALYALPFQHYWKSYSADTVEVSTRGYQIIQSAGSQDLDGVSVDLDEAGADLLDDFMMGMAADPAVVSPSPVASPSQRPVWHVSQGQTLDGIARAVRVPVMVLARYNHLANPNQIDVGQVLSIPQEVRVKSGDTLSGIVDGLHEAGITWQFIADVNQINPNRLWVGQQVWV